MFVGCPNIQPVCVGSVPRLAEDLVRYGNFIRPFLIALINAAVRIAFFYLIIYNYHAFPEN